MPGGAEYEPSAGLQWRAAPAWELVACEVPVGGAPGVPPSACQVVSPHGTRNVTRRPNYSPREKGYSEHCVTWVKPAF